MTDLGGIVENYPFGCTDARLLPGWGSHMDVSVTVSLQGGHQWQFVAEAGSPMVTGLVSALPGATSDASLPPDGLIQLEARSGEKLFVTRSTLVSVSIVELDDQGRHLPTAKLGFARSSSPAPFVFLSDCFADRTRANLEAALSIADFAPVAANVREILLDRLPIDAERALSSAIDDSLIGFGIAATDAVRHLDVRALHINHSAIALEAKQAIVCFIALLPLTKEAKVFGSIDLLDQRGDGSRAEGAREVMFEANCLLIYPATVSASAFRLTSGEGVILQGALHESAPHDGEPAGRD